MVIDDIDQPAQCRMLLGKERGRGVTAIMKNTVVGNGYVSGWGPVGRRSMHWISVWDRVGVVVQHPKLEIGYRESTGVESGAVSRDSPISLRPN